MFITYNRQKLNIEIPLNNEQIEIPLLLTNADEKFISLQSNWNGNAIKKNVVDNAFKIFTQVKKLKERSVELQSELTEVEQTLKEFLSFINGHQIAYEKKDDVEKLKITYLFWLEDGEIKCNR